MPRKILHIVRRTDDPHALAVAARQREAGEEVTVVLIHEAAGVPVSPPKPLEGAVFPLPPSAEGYDRLFELIAVADSIVTW